MVAKKKNLLLLYERPQEPCFKGKGPKNAVFVMPIAYLPDRYKPIATELVNRFNEEAGEKIPVAKITLPDISEILKLSRNENFSLFIPKHRALAGRLITILSEMRTIEELQSMAVYVRDRVNPYLFNYAFSVVLLHRKDTQDLDVPTFFQSFPDKFLDSKVFSRAREEAAIVPTGSREPIEIPMDYTASNLEEEQRIAYFREDLGINLHHWHWHLVYPFDGPLEIVDKDRRGELFVYMHEQFLAKYDAERFCAGLKRVTPLANLREPIAEAYFPKMNSLVASRAYPGRPSNQTLKDLTRGQDQIHVTVAQLETWRTRIFDAIHSGRVRDSKNNSIVLTETEGINTLGNMIESCILSPDSQFYGNCHNMGHVLLSYIHDPDQRHLESFSTIGDSATAMRDPIFYRWHKHIDDICVEFQATLPRYTIQQLGYDGIAVTGVQVQSQNSKPNILNTFWQQSDADMSRGMDFQPRGSVFVRFTHLNHQDFTYTINVNNSGAERQGTCRIFYAPTRDERGNPWLFNDQRRQFIELDKFVVNLRAGQNTITRRSTQSSVTIPFERTFRNLDADRPEGGEALEQFNFCGCGWPHHMLICKGLPGNGLLCNLFVMISNIEFDRVVQDTSGICNDAASFCGIKDRRYPDKRAMGYPFDRRPRDGVDTIQQFLTPNMRVQDFRILFTNRTVRPKARVK